MQNIGFTGTRKGMSSAQKFRLGEFLRSISKPATLHHGAAIGADIQAAEIALGIGMEIVPYPAGKDPLARNRQIVDSTTILVAAPKWVQEITRSGTWATIRYARRMGKVVVMVLPDGQLVFD